MDVNNFMITGLKKSIFLESDYFLKFCKDTGRAYIGSRKHAYILTTGLASLFMDFYKCRHLFTLFFTTNTEKPAATTWSE